LLLPGQRHDSVGVASLIDGVPIAALIGDKAFDNNSLREDLSGRGVSAVIPPKGNRKADISCDYDMYKWRHLIENFFCSLKGFRRIATRYDKTDESFAAMIYLAASLIALR
jgi:transposase